MNARFGASQFCASDTGPLPLAAVVEVPLDTLTDTGSSQRDIAPLGILQNDAIAIMVFVCATMDIPVRIERNNSPETGPRQVCT